jgi:hypothetical protein
MEQKEMWLVICSPHDESAIWAYHGLRMRGLSPVELVTADMLTTNARWKHTVGVDGANINITLADGRVIDNRAVRGVVNRLTHVPLDHLSGAPDYEYATQEYTALFMSWLRALPTPMYNEVDNQGLSGAWRHASEWVYLATQAGLPTCEYVQSSHDEFDDSVTLRRLLPEGTPTTMAITVGDRVFGPFLPPAVNRACRELARLSRTQILGIELAVNNAPQSLTFAGATPMPDLRVGGEQFLDALAVSLFKNQRSN